MGKQVDQIMGKVSRKWLKGGQYAGVLVTATGECSVTVVSEFLAITAKHCGRVNPRLKLDVSAASTSGHGHVVKSITVHRDLDVEALFLRDRTGLTVSALRASVARDQFSTWGYGQDWSNNPTNYLTRSDFSLPQLCPSSANATQGQLCWQTSATNSVCYGDSGGPVTQNGAIIGMVTNAAGTSTLPDGNPDCSTIELGQALPVQELQPWLDQMIQDANPFP
jgi:V8-like Glu-specific endopeptidase